MENMNLSDLDKQVFSRKFRLKYVHVCICMHMYMYESVQGLLRRRKEREQGRNRRTNCMFSYMQKIHRRMHMTQKQKGAMCQGGQAPARVGRIDRAVWRGKCEQHTM